MEKTRLIQRLKAPVDHDVHRFGGGLKNGGITDEAMQILRPIFSFDYMGRAEFEYGAVPEALGKMATYCQKKGIFRRRHGIIGEVSLIRPVYYVCSREQKPHVEELVTLLGEKGDKEMFLKEPTYLQEAITDVDYAQQYQGWLELDNGFAFFADKGMYMRFAKMMGFD